MNPRFSDTRMGYEIRNLTIGAVVASQARRFGDKVYMKFLPEGTQFTYSDLERLTNSVANGLAHLGLKRGMHVAMFMENCPESLFALIGAGKIGCVAAPINAAARGMQLRYFIDFFDCVAIIVEDALFPRVIELLPELPRLKTIVCIPAPGSKNPDVPRPAIRNDVTVLSYRELEGFPSNPPDTQVAFRDLAMLAFTSGTTGPSKGNMHTQAKWLLSPISHLEAWQCTPEDVFYTALPAFHTNALHGTLFPALLMGASAVMSRRFSASNFWREIRDSNATVVNLLGSMSNILWGAPSVPEERQHRLRICNAAPVPAFYAGFEKRFRVRIGSVYGLTDFGVPTSLPLDALPEKKLSVGKARLGWQVRIVDLDDFDLPSGKAGEIALRTDNLWEASLGYYKMPDKTLEAFRNGWWHTGDHGYLDEEGYLWFVERQKDAMRRRGENVSAFEVEQGLLSHPDVAEVAVFPVRSEMSEDEICAAVVLRSGASVIEKELIEHCARCMAYFMVPRYLLIAEALPRTLTQKVEKYKLKEAAEADITRLWDREKAGIKVQRT